MEQKILIRVPELSRGYGKRMERALNAISGILREYDIPFEFVGNSGRIFLVERDGIIQMDPTDDCL